MSDKNNSGLEVGRSDTLPSALPVAARLLNWTGPKNLAVFPPSGVVARTFDELPRDSAKSTWSEGDALVRLSDAEAALLDAISESRAESFGKLTELNAELVEALNAMLTFFGMDEDEWNCHTFKKARAALLKAEGAKS